ncbi:apolipoprotein C-I isoform X2 [Talpa occidentalis]|nr:apolipoprotein C-I isoform X2 [Talpa occidentalis]XP_037374071.1 apolipoprotein C-I isoform X2 [Talpa occidentalis]XP_054553580.1 apolipoprotein C-I isoform X2 [Talpa occidentalis]
MRLILSLSVLLVVLSVVLEGPTPAQADPDISGTLESIPGKLKEIGKNLGQKARTTLHRIKESEFPSKARNWFSGVFHKIKERVKTTFS